MDEPQNLVSYHLRLLRDGGLVPAVRSSLDGRDSYHHRDLDRCDKAREACPDFPGRPRRVLWSIPEPATTGGTDRAGCLAFRRTAADIETRVRHLLPALNAVRS